MTTTSKLIIKNINLNKKLQMRQNGVSGDVIETYARSMENGEVFPPITVFQVKRTMWLVDGWHRLKATELIGEEMIAAEVIQGTWEEALHHARFVANRKNGQRLSRADMDALLTELVIDDQYKSWTATKLAELAGVSVPTVIAKRRKLDLIPEETTTATGAVRQGSMTAGSSFRLDSLIEGSPPAGIKAPEDGGYTVLTERVSDRLREHLDDVEASLNKLEGAELQQWMKDPQRDELVGKLDRLHRILGAQAK